MTPWVFIHYAYQEPALMVRSGEYSFAAIMKVKHKNKEEIVDDKPSSLEPRKPRKP